MKKEHRLQQICQGFHLDTRTKKHSDRGSFTSIQRAS